MRTLKHLPENEWPEADRQSLRAAYEPGDIFDETAGPGAHLAESSRKAIKFAYRRWLGFLKANYADDLSTAPPERITPERVRAFIEHLSAQMKPTSVLVNTSRGPVVDQTALADALRNGVIWAAALDVTDPEPIPRDDPLVGLDNCLIVPHIASASRATRGKMAAMAAANLIAGVRGESLPTEVPPP